MTSSLRVTSWSRSFGQRWFIIILTFRNQKLSICTILLANYNRLTIQEILIPLTTIWIIRIGEVSRVVRAIIHLNTLCLTELDILLLLLLLLMFQSRGTLSHLIWSVLWFLRWLLAIYQVCGFTFDRLRIGLRHIPRVCPHKSTWLSVSRIVTICKFIKRTFGKIKHHLIMLHPFLILSRVNLYESRTNHVIKFVSFCLQSFPFRISLLLSHHWIFVLPSIKLLRLVLFHLLLSTLTQVEHCNRFKY